MPRPSPPRRPDPPPLEGDEVRVVAVGTALFTVALVALLLAHEQAAEAGIGWMVWSCVTGIVLGGLGLVLTRRRRDAVANRTLPPERQARQPEPPVRQPTASSPD